MKDDVHEKILLTYGVENWGAGYYEVNSKGHLVVRAERNDGKYVDVAELVDDLVQKRRLKTPLLLRFPQLLVSQMQRLHNVYAEAKREFGYQGRHFPVIPMKVNPRREVIETFLKEGAKYHCGVECGSKAELYAAIALDQSPESLLICNGFKDEAFVDLALMGTRIGKRVVLVIEKLNELKMVLRRAQESGVKPWIGLRAKLYSRGMGKWASSGGEAAKFGLTTSEILECMRLLKECGMDSSLKLLHFHIGSQITDIKRVKNAMKEAARVYAKIRALDFCVEYLDIGGGMGVDYDGSKTNFEASVNYTMQEFANDVLYTIQSVCEDENVPSPNIVTESGRVMTSYHALFITSIWDEIETFADNQSEVSIDDDDPQVISELKDLMEGINGKNYREYYHDALDHKDEMHTQFNLGLISLEDRSKGEVLFWDVCAKALRFSRQAKVPPEEFEDVKRILASKYLCNFSLFRSAPDHWAIDQLFPIMPIHRLDELPTDIATMVDVTCDSDGIIDKFVDLKDVKEVLELHDPGDKPYYLAIFLVGAYQEVMGSNHNLFGLPNEAHVVMAEEGRYHVTKIVPGNTVGDMIQFARYDKSAVAENFRKLAAQRVVSGDLDEAAAAQLVARYEADAGQYTYLENGR